jgi:hypothetical protein
MMQAQGLGFTMTPFEQGYQAGRQNRECVNPFRVGSFSHTDWESGYWRGREKRDCRAAQEVRSYYETR